MATDYAALSPDEQTTTGLPNTKLAMWLFLASECLLFGALITTYVLYRGASQTGPYPADVFDIPYTSVSSFVLLASFISTRNKIMQSGIKYIQMKSRSLSLSLK